MGYDTWIAEAKKPILQKVYMFFIQILLKFMLFLFERKKSGCNFAHITAVELAADMWLDYKNHHTAMRKFQIEIMISRNLCDIG